MLAGEDAKHEEPQARATLSLLSEQSPFSYAFQNPAVSLFVLFLLKFSVNGLARNYKSRPVLAE